MNQNVAYAATSAEALSVAAETAHSDVVTRMVSNEEDASASKKRKALHEDGDDVTNEQDGIVPPAKKRRIVERTLRSARRNDKLLTRRFRHHHNDIGMHISRHILRKLARQCQSKSCRRQHNKRLETVLDRLPSAAAGIQLGRVFLHQDTIVSLIAGRHYPVYMGGGGQTAYEFQTLSQRCAGSF